MDTSYGFDQRSALALANHLSITSIILTSYEMTDVGISAIVNNKRMTSLVIFPAIGDSKCKSDCAKIQHYIL